MRRMAGSSSSETGWRAVVKTIRPVGPIIGRRPQLHVGEARVDAAGIAMPDIDRGIRDGATLDRVDHGDIEMERNARPAFRDVAANAFGSNVERPFLLLGSQDEGIRDGGLLLRARPRGEAISGQERGSGSGDEMKRFPASKHS